MNRSEHLLSCLAEECAEVAQRVSKALRFDEGLIPEPIVDRRERLAKIERFMAISREHGALQ